MKNCLVLILFFSALILIGGPGIASAASLSILPPAGSFTIGSTFDVSVFLDTQGASVNAIQMSLSFPPDKLQLVSPATSKSIISVWTSQPKFNNQTGIIDFQGGIPGGINVSSGLVTTLTFRAKSGGDAILKFLDNSKVLLNDGLGTDALRQTQSAFYDLVLPPPAGPLVVSKTHPDQARWYANSLVILDWAPSAGGAEGFSYMLSDNPVDQSDDISEGLQSSVAYKNIADGAHYFHIKALRNGVWGGTTHYEVNIDTTPPAEFPVEIVPAARTVRAQPIVQFFTTDAFSGLDHYELKIVALSPSNSGSETDSARNQTLFVEAQSPYLTQPLQVGNYDVILRAYDKAGNYREEVKRLEIRQAIFEFVNGQGLRLRSQLVIPWIWVWLFGGILIVILAWLAVRLNHWHRLHDLKLASGELPHHIQNQLEELKRFKQKYGKTLVTLLIIGFSLLSLILTKPVLAQSSQVSPPFVTTVSRSISNEEIFYIGGKSDISGATIIIYLQNARTGEVLSENTETDKKGDWFYRHNSFLSTGTYLVWTQTKIGDELSPPSPQIQLTIQPTAIQFGSSRLSYETLYLVLALILLLAVLSLGSYVVYHGVHARRKHLRFQKEVKEAEESVRRGFAVLRRDIQAELTVVKKAKLSKELSAEEKQREEQLFRDMAWVEKYIGKEVWDIERTEPQ
ncbi:MAG: cohesin domain-containing protein [Patescibacteria group bacterium]